MNPALESPDAYLLTLLAGILLVYVECNRPGRVVPGCAGGVLMLVALHRFAQLPLRGGALALAAGGAGLLGAGLMRRGWVLASAAGILVISCGLWLLVQPSAIPRVHPQVALGVSVVFGLSTVWLGRVAVRAHRNKRVPGWPGRGRRGASGCRTR